MFKIRSLTLDAAKKTLKGKFQPSTTAERDFNKALKKVARVSGHIVEAHAHGADLIDPHVMDKALKDYAKLITPWAQRQSAKMLEKVQQSNKRAYKNKSKAIGTALNLGVAEKDVGEVARKLLNEQVALIQSIPLEAGLRAQKIAYQNFLKGTRAIADPAVVQRLLNERLDLIQFHNLSAAEGGFGDNDLEEEMSRSMEVAINRATLIARTETARATASINQARAVSVGSNQYRWHNSGDGAVRHSHKIYKGKPLQGKIFSWDDPPTLDDGMKGNPGEFPNCRCFAEPVFPTE